MTDCGPGCIGTTDEVAQTINMIFLEQDPIDEFLMDNDTAFCLKVLDK